MAAGQDGMTFRIVLLGKTGNGKSSLGNVLLGKESPEGEEVLGGPYGFKVGRGMQSKTTECNWGKAVRFGMTFEVTDTPGLCDTYMDEEKIYKELAKSVAVARPGPNIIFFVLRADRKFTTEELEAYQTIKALFSEKISDYLILVFNGIDELCSDTSIAQQRRAHKDDVDSFVKLPSKNAKALSTMMSEAGERYIGMNNKARPAVLETQIKDLVKMMQDLVKKNGNTIYKTEMTQEINRRVDDLVRQQAMPQFPAIPQYQAMPQFPAIPQQQAMPQFRAIPHYQAMPQFRAIPQYQAMPQFPAIPQYQTTPQFPAVPQRQAMPETQAMPQAQAMAQTQAVTQTQSEPDIQTKIVNEDVPMGFFEKLGDVIYRGFQKAKRVASDMCSMM